MCVFDKVESVPASLPNCLFLYAQQCILNKNPSAGTWGMCLHNGTHQNSSHVHNTPLFTLECINSTIRIRVYNIYLKDTRTCRIYTLTPNNGTRSVDPSACVRARVFAAQKGLRPNARAHAVFTRIAERTQCDSCVDRDGRLEPFKPFGIYSGAVAYHGSKNGNLNYITNLDKYILNIKPINLSVVTKLYSK